MTDDRKCAEARRRRRRRKRRAKRQESRAGISTLDDRRGFTTIAYMNLNLSYFFRIVFILPSSPAPHQQRSHHNLPRTTLEPSHSARSPSTPFNLPNSFDSPLPNHPHSASPRPPSPAHPKHDPYPQPAKPACSNTSPSIPSPPPLPPARG